MDDEGVVREKLDDDPPCKSFRLYDLEGELFFGAAPELERYFAILTQRAQAERIHYIVLRVKRVRNPDGICLEQLEHFLKHSESLDITVLLARVRPDLLDALRRLRFAEWFPADRVFPQATGRGLGDACGYSRSLWKLADRNACEHCVPRKAVKEKDGGSTTSFEPLAFILCASIASSLVFTQLAGAPASRSPASTLAFPAQSGSWNRISRRGSIGVPRNLQCLLDR